MQSNKINILGVRVDSINARSLRQKIATYIKQDNHILILHVNIHCLNLAYNHGWLRAFLNRAEIVFCDGAGVKLGVRILGYHIPQRFTFADELWHLAEFAEQRGLTFFFLGARPGVAEKAAQCLKECFPDLHIVGIHHGYFDKTPDSPENDKIINKINKVKPNILIVAFGMPMQERWLMENWPRIKANTALTLGAVFDYVSGTLRRGPKCMTDHGFEWLARLIIEPRRLWKRYLIGNPLFLWRLLKQRFGVLKSD